MDGSSVNRFWSFGDLAGLECLRWLTHMVLAVGSLRVQVWWSTRVSSPQYDFHNDWL